MRRCTLSRISIRLSASAGLSGGEPFDDCSTRNIVEIMKGMSRDSTPSLARSLGTTGGRSGEMISPRQWAMPAMMGAGAHSEGPGVRQTYWSPTQWEGVEAEGRAFLLEAFIVILIIKTEQRAGHEVGAWSQLSVKRFGHSHGLVAPKQTPPRERLTLHLVEGRG